MINFKKCDFHIHSPFSDGGKDCLTGNNLNENLDIFAEKLLNKATKNNFDAIAITDHDSVSKYLYNRLTRQNEIKIFTGFEKKFKFTSKTIKEFDLNIKNETFDAIIIFDEVKIDNAIKILETYKDDSGNYRSIEFENFVDDFSEIKFYFVPHSGNKSNSIDKSLPNGNVNNERFKRMLIKSNFNNFALDANKGSISKILQRDFSIDAPVFSFSDSHTIDKFGNFNEFGNLYA